MERLLPYYISAYGMAVKRGYNGTLDEWLAGLKGYVHIRFADRYPEFPEDLKTDGGEWMGIYADNCDRDSDDPQDYAWMNIKGSANAAAIAPVYMRGMIYGYGDVVSRGEKLYACTAARSGEEFDPTEWEETTLYQSVMERGLAGTVSYEPQETTAAQKEAARRNIGALSDGRGSVKEDNIDTGAVGKGKIGMGAVDTNELEVGAVREINIYAGAVTETKIGPEAVSNGKLGYQAVKHYNIHTGAVETEDIKDGAVNGAKLNLHNGDLGEIILTHNVHYFDSREVLPAPTVGRLVFVKAAE